MRPESVSGSQEAKGTQTLVCHCAAIEQSMLMRADEVIE